MQIEWSEGEVLKSAGVGTEAEVEVVAVNRAEFSSCGEAVSWRSCEQPWWRTELDLSSGKSFDDRHRSTTLGATPKRVGFLGGGGFWFPRHRNRTQGNEAQRQ